MAYIITKMKKISIFTLLIVAVMFFSGCLKKTEDTPQINNQSSLPKANPVPKNETAKDEPLKDSDVGASELEKTVPNANSDLFTILDENGKDLQLLDNDLKEIDELDMDESNDQIE